MSTTSPHVRERDDSRLLHKRSLDSNSSSGSDVDELDPLHEGKPRPYRDNDQGGDQDVKYNSLPPKTLAWLEEQRTKGRWRRWFVPSRFCCGLLLLFCTTTLLLLGTGGFWVYQAAVPQDGQSEPWYPSPRGGTVGSWQESYAKAAKLVGKMSLVEKVNITTGTGWSMDMCVGNTGRVDRLGFPSLCLQDGPLGLRFVQNATAWPAGVTVGATWNRELMYLRGQGHGFEAKKKGIHVLLGPAMGPLGRLPAGGRNWEGFGADPYLQGVASAETIRGIQNAGVIATAKHFVGNEQEHFRQSWEWKTPNAISSNVDDRTLHEIYAWPFADAIHAGVGSIMCSYNQVNNSYACQNSKLLNGVLKDELGFQGFVHSDWLAQRSGVASALAGLDMSMPGDGLVWADGQALWGSELTKAVLNTSVPMGRLNDMAMRVVATWYKMGQDNVDEWPSLGEGGVPSFSSWTDEEIGRIHHGSPDSTEEGVVNRNVPLRNTRDGGDHDSLARKIAAEGIVMVKNEGNLLPLSRNGSTIKGKVSGDGSRDKIRVGIFGEDAFTNPNGINACVDRSCNEGTLTMGWGSGSVELPYLVAPADALRKNFDSQTIQITEWTSNQIDHIEATATEQDICFVFINSDAGEGYLSWENVNGDRNDLYSQKGGDILVKRVADSCPSTIVVLHSVGPTILEKWIDSSSVKAVLLAHLPGQESGNALADIIFGDVNPSGRLPYTVGKREEDYGPDSKILRLPNAVVPQQDFTEGLYIDYRYFDKYNITPRYEFGFGLSYTSFKLSSFVVQPLGVKDEFPKPRPDAFEAPRLDETIPKATLALRPSSIRRVGKYIYPYIDSPSDVKKGRYPYPKGYDEPHALSPAGGGEGGNPDLWEPVVRVQATVTNLGSVAGDVVVQLYVSFPPDVISPVSGEGIDMPVKVLRGFQKVHVSTDNAGKRQPVRMELTRRDLSYWDVTAQNWVMPTKGDFKVYLGFSSRDLPVQSSFSMGGLNFNFGGGS